MVRKVVNLNFLVLLAGLFLVLPVTAADSGVVPPPKAEYSKTSKCVAPIMEMRKDHMEKILHQRDLTVHKGIRTKQNSLSECINCHITPKKDGNFAKFGEDEHFCSNCHNYAAVTVDCFECHRDKPENSKAGHSLTKRVNPHTALTLNSKPVHTNETLDNTIMRLK